MSLPVERLIEKQQRQQFWRRLFRRVFLEDWGTKLMALGISLALWLGVTGLRSPVEERLDKIPLNIRVANNIEIIEPLDQEIQLSITGDERAIQRINKKDLVASIDLTDAGSGDQVVQLTPEILRLELPNGLKIGEIIPSKILVRLEKVEEREVNVKPDIEGNLPEDLEVYAVSVVPSKVRVRGAESFLKSIDSVSTAPINLNNRRESFGASQVGLNVINSKVTLLDTIVEVNIRIGEKRAERIFTVVIKSNVQSESKRASVVLYGARSVIEKIRAEDLHVEIQTTGASDPEPRLIMPTDLQDKIEVRKIRLPS